MREGIITRAYGLRLTRLLSFEFWILTFKSPLVAVVPVSIERPGVIVSYTYVLYPQSGVWTILEAGMVSGTAILL
jgi:hypothetical protein